MRFRVAAFFGVSAACAVSLAAACIPDLITDPFDAGTDAAPDSGPRCGDGVIDPPAETCDPNSYADGGAQTILGCQSNCRVDCGDGGVRDPLNGHCYFVGGAATSLDDGDNSAVEVCKRSGAHVVTYADDVERQFVVSSFGDVLKVGNNTAFWVGLSLDPAKLALVPPENDISIREPGWSPACSGCYAAPNVDGSIPRLVLDAGGSCVLDVGAIGWSQFPCSQIPQAIPVLCEREPAGDSWRPCNGGFCAQIAETAPAKNYLFSFAALASTEARNACAGLGGSLVVFASRQERETLLRSLLLHYDILATNDPSASAPNEVWIGYESDDAGIFGWDDDGGFSGSPWGDNQPTPDASLPARAYVDLNTDDYDVQLAHDDTDVARPYICQY